MSISPNNVNEPIFLFNSDLHLLIASFIESLEGLVSESRTQIKLLFPDIGTTIQSKLSSILEKLDQRHNQRKQANLDDCDDDCFASTHVLQIPKNQLNELQEHLEHYCNVLPVFCFNSAKYDLNSIKSYLLPVLINERDIELFVIKSAK